MPAELADQVVPGDGDQLGREVELTHLLLLLEDEPSRLDADRRPGVPVVQFTDRGCENMEAHRSVSPRRSARGRSGRPSRRKPVPVPPCGSPWVASQTELRTDSCSP